MPQFVRDIFDSVPVGYLVRAIHIIFILVLAYIVYKMIDSGLNRLRMIIPSDDLIGHARMKQRTETLRSVVRSVSKAIIILFVILQIGSELGFLASLAPLLATAGIGGLAVGFGAQSLVKDVISGFFILSEDQFGVGDVVIFVFFLVVVECMILWELVMLS